MKGEVYGKRELSPLVGMSKKSSQNSSNSGVGRQRRRK
jgi:small subunit ribosomal protein S3